VQFVPSEDEEFAGTVVGQAGGVAAVYLRMFNAGGNLDTPRPDTLSQAGLITINVRPTLNYAGSDRYRRQFRNEAGDEAPSVLGSLQADISVHFFDKLYLTAGYNWSSSSLVQGTGFAGFSLSRGRARE
jgi:hypothetical protein